MVRPLCRAASWWRRLGTLLLLVGIVLSPLRAMAATIPVLTAYEVAVRSTATTVLGKHDAVRPETERARTACADATFAYDDFSNWPAAAGLRGVLAYDGAVELTERRELTEGAIYDATAPTAAAEGAGAAARFLVAPSGATIETGLSAAELLVPNGVRIGEAGASSSIRVIQGGSTEAGMLFEQLSAGGTPVAGNYPGTLVNLGSGGTVGLRTVATGTGARLVPAVTIDVNIPGVAIRELKFVP